MDSYSNNGKRQSKIPSEILKNILDIAENNEHLFLNPVHSEKYVWDWNDDCGIGLLQMDDSWFLHIKEKYVDFLNSELPLLSEREFTNEIRNTLERLQIRIPKDSFLAERLERMGREQSREKQSLWCIVAERSYAYAACNILGYSPERVQEDLRCTLQVVTHPIWRHDVFGV